MVLAKAESRYQHVISYTSNWAYVLFAAIGAWIGGYLSITALDWASPVART